MPRMALRARPPSGTLGRSPQPMSEAPLKPASPKSLDPRLPFVGLGMAILGLLVAITSLFFKGESAKDFSMPLILIGVGSFLYIPGSFLVFYTERRNRMKPMMGYLRWVRLGFVVLVLYWIFRISQ